MMYSLKAHPTVLIRNLTLTYLILTMFISMARIKRLKAGGILSVSYTHLDVYKRQVKLFPRHCGQFVKAVQEKLIQATGKQIEVMVYGDGAFKDPVGKIWELADPVVSPAYTSGLEGTPNEVKLKYLADNDRCV